MKRGNLLLIIGNMFAGKTEELIREIKKIRKYAKKKVLIFSPEIDTRSGPGKIRGRNGETLAATNTSIEDASLIIDYIHKKEEKTKRKFDVIAIDEVQFFGKDSKIYETIDYLLQNGYDVVAAGLRLDFKGEPFGSTLQLIGLCNGMHDVTLLHSYCVKCGERAALPQRLINGLPVPYSSKQIKVDMQEDKESYEARCYACHELPGKPVL